MMPVVGYQTGLNSVAIQGQLLDLQKVFILKGVTLFSGCGPDDETARYWCMSGSAVWNNSGDTVFLRDPSGNIVASLSYGDSG